MYDSKKTIYNQQLKSKNTMRIKIKYLTIFKLALIIYVFISLGCKTFILKKKKKTAFYAIAN
jgi:hypothetical protein